MKTIWVSFALIFSVCCIIFSQFFLKGFLPIPSDSLVGLYHPFRDFYGADYPNGIPFKNFLITDPVRQQYPWRFLGIEKLQSFSLPLWNPYTFSGSPLLANLQSATFYPLNILFAVFPFHIAWSVLVLLQPLLMGLFLFVYLRYFKLSILASILGAIAYAFSGFSVAWMEWNTVVHTALWLPLILLAKEHLLKKFTVGWVGILLFAEVSMIFAGHLQTFFYAFIISNIYLIGRIVQLSQSKIITRVIDASVKKYFPFIGIGIVIFLITSIQLVPTFQFIQLSARDIDRSSLQEPGWFVPYEHLVQFVAPDFFGNPTTLNYWGVWNYAELVGYIGIIPILMAFFALICVRSKKTLFFGSLVFVSLLFALPTPLAEIPFLLQIPFLSTAQPTRLFFLIDFGLSVLAAIGFDRFQMNRKRFFIPLLFVIAIFGALWIVMMQQNDPLQIGKENVLVSRRNLILPSLLLGIATIGYLLTFVIKYKRFVILILVLFLSVSVFDVTRFSQKFLPFSSPHYLYPQTKIIDYLQDQPGIFRIMSTDSRVLPPNVSMMYKLQTVDGYDPLYLRRYAELIAASERNEPNIQPPFGFNRIITPHRYDSRIIDLLGVSYVLSLSDIESEKLEKIHQEGETRLYKNTKAFMRAFFVENIIVTQNKQESISALFDPSTDINSTAVVEGERGGFSSAFTKGTVSILEYSADKVVLETVNEGEGFLVLMDTFYPTWHATIDNEDTPIFLTNYTFRGLVVPKGRHTVEFYNTLF